MTITHLLLQGGPFLAHRDVWHGTQSSFESQFCTVNRYGKSIQSK